jgi:hypothetical protein
MNRNNLTVLFGTVVIIGSIWGFSEAGLGMWLRSCASLFSGTIMTGVALFFMAGAWVMSRRIFSIVLLVLIASLFKLFDALFLSLPIKHGAVANPIFAFAIEGAAFLVLILIFNEKLRQKITGQALFGGMAALLAANLFPLVKHATGIPACVFPGTVTPLSLYYAPLAVLISAILVPLGFYVGSQIRILEPKLEQVYQRTRLGYFLSPATVILGLAIIALIRFY